MEIKTAEEIYKIAGKKFLSRSLDKLPTSAIIPPVLDWLEKNRYMPKEITENYGQFNRFTAPHLIEPLARIHPDDDSTHIAIMKSVQSAATTTLIEGAMAFYTMFKLGSCLYLTSTKSMGRVRSSSALDVLIDNCGLADSIKPLSARMKRKTADTTFYKEFAGGVKWLITSYNSIGDMKSNTFHLVCADEWDEAGVELADQGDIAGIIEGRTMAARQYKILYVSTPSRMETSRIYKSFLEGDQRLFFVPCPLCGKSQVLILRGQGKKHGLTFNLKKDQATGARLLDRKSVRYICEYCSGEFTEVHKQEMLEAGAWVPTWQNSDSKPKSPYHRSYNNQGLLSPFLSWERICQQFINTEFGENLMLFKDFTINYMGRPWTSQSKKADWETIYERRDKYNPGEIPAGVLQLTAGADVHKDRIEVLVVGWGPGGESWIIEKKVFYGSTDDLNNPIWTELNLWALTTEYKILNKNWGITKIAIDQGYNPTEKKTLGRSKDYARKPNIVQEFVAANHIFISVRGVPGEGEIIRGHRVQGSNLKKRYDVAVDVLKEDIFARLDRTEGPGSIHFPDFEKENFKQFCSEVFKELKPRKFGWGKIYERNEVLDCYVYADAVAHYLGIKSRSFDVWNEYRQQMVDY